MLAVFAGACDLVHINAVNEFPWERCGQLTLTLPLVSMGFTVREFIISKQTGLANGQTAVWSTVDENFFDELAKDCIVKYFIVKSDSAQ